MHERRLLGPTAIDRSSDIPMKLKPQDIALESSLEAEWSVVRKRPELPRLTERIFRVERKLLQARALLAACSIEAREAQLLGVAILRRDEALLDELMARLQSE